MPVDPGTANLLAQLGIIYLFFLIVSPIAVTAIVVWVILLNRREKRRRHF